MSMFTKMTAVAPTAAAIKDEDGRALLQAINENGAVAVPETEWQKVSVDLPKWIRNAVPGKRLKTRLLKSDKSQRVLSLVDDANA